MITSINPPARDTLSTVLREELTLSPARWRAMARIASGTSILVAIAMTFQIPLPAYVVYLVFLVSQEDAASTLVSSFGGLLAVTLAVALSILLYIFDASEPALRIPLLAFSIFAGTFLARTSKLGPITFLAGYVLVFSQTVLDNATATEPLLRGLLWLWVIAALPVGLTILLNLLCGESPVVLSRNRAVQLLERVASCVELPFSESPNKIRSALLALGQLKNKALLWDKRLKAYAEEDARLIELLVEIQSIARSLPANTPMDIRRVLGQSIREAGQHFMARRTCASAKVESTSRSSELPYEQPNCAALQFAVRELLERASGESSMSTSTSPKATSTFFVADAFTNRAHARFAIKVMLAVLASYATYTLLDWPGISTAVTTCFFVTLTTFGESMHKFTLRATGAIIGGLLAGLCLVFVLPLMTDIGELCLMIAAVSAFCAWISTGSETISYAGMQIAFAFFLGVLQGYGPASDLTVLRDRIAGILIGNLWVTVVFASLWPTSAVAQARSLRAAALKKLSQLLSTDPTSSSSKKLAINQDLSSAAHLNARAVFEWVPIKGEHAVFLDTEKIERITSLALTLVRIRDANPTTASLHDVDDPIAMQLDALAENRQAPIANVEHDASVPPTLRQARMQLEKEIGYVSRTI